jgi:hypothetical protein
LEKSQQFDFEGKHDLYYVFVPWDWLVRHQSLCTILMFITKGQFRSVGACTAM